MRQLYKSWNMNQVSTDIHHHGGIDIYARENIGITGTELQHPYREPTVVTYRIRKCKPHRILQLQPFDPQEVPLQQYCKDDRGDDLFRLQLSFSPTLFNDS